MIKPPVNVLNFVLAPEKESEILDQVIEDEINRIDEDLDRAFPDDMLPTMKELPPKERHARYMKLTPESDIKLLSVDTYLEDLAAGKAPPPFSQFWNQLLAIPELFLEVRKDFMSLHKRYMP